MKVDIAYTRSVVGWDITITAVGEGGERVAHVYATCNDSPFCDENVDPQSQQWRRVFRQKGVYPGDNKVIATVTNDKGDDYTSTEKWTN